MANKNKKLILVGGIILLLIGTIALTYAFFSTGGKQELANTFTSGCLRITIESETNSISLNNAYPVSDVEGLTNTPYTFTIKNTCDKATNYQINLESINQTASSLSANYVKVALSSDTMDNLVSILGSNTAVDGTITGSYEAYNLYTGTIDGNTTKTFNLREWIDYDVTKEEGASKTFSNKINVIANPNLIITGAPEIKTTLTDNTLTGVITGSASTASYCATTTNKCTANTALTITDNTISIDLDRSNNQIVCTSLDSGKTMCSDVIPQLSGVETILALYTEDSTNLAYDEAGNLRYIGANPNNYVSFNNELWRIIGVFSVDDGNGNVEQRLKLIRSESIGGYSWDSSASGINNGYGVNEWSQADVMKLLNGGYESETVDGSLYWNSGSGTCYSGSSEATTSCDFTSSGLGETAKSLIGNALWNTGSNGSNGFTSSDNGTPSHFYTYERSTNSGKRCTSGTYCNDTVARTTTWIGQVGLMYPSDYGYATSGGSTTNREACLATEMYNWDGSSDCYNNDWLLMSNNFQWTLNPRAHSSGAYRVFGVASHGYVDRSNASDASAVRPVVYLKSNVVITGGEGSTEIPFELKA